MIKNADGEKIVEITLNSEICQNFTVKVAKPELQENDRRKTVRRRNISGLIFVISGILTYVFIPEETLRGVQAIPAGILTIIIGISFLSFIFSIFQVRKCKKQILCGTWVEITQKNGIHSSGDTYDAYFSARDRITGYEKEFYTGDIKGYHSFEVSDRVLLVDYVSRKDLEKYGIIADGKTL